MARQISYSQNTYRPGDDVLPGNSAANQPVEFDLAPADGSELARIKSIIVATSGLVADSWNPEIQDMVLKAFQTGSMAFVNTVEAVRGLTVPAALAKRVGIIGELPMVVQPGDTTPKPDRQAPIPITTGLQFSLISGFTDAMVLAMNVAKEILDLSNRTAVDARLFVQPSGSGGTVMPSGPNGTVTSAQPAPEGKGTAAKRKTGRRRVLLTSPLNPGTSPNS